MQVKELNNDMSSEQVDQEIEKIKKDKQESLSNQKANCLEIWVTVMKKGIL